MFAEGLTPDLLFAAAVVAFGCVLLVRRPLGLRWALGLAAVRVAIPLCFFGFLDTGEWRQLDDLTYTEEAAELVATGVGPVGLIVDPLSNAALFQAAGGRHVGYYAFNVLAHSFFGDHYWSAVFLNVLLTFVAARAVLRILALLDFSPDHARAAAIFFLLHWDVIAWSSFHNLKDSLVLALTAWTFAHALSFVKRASLRSALLAVAAAFLLTFVRWYVPVLILGAFGAWGLLNTYGWRRALLLGVILLGLLTQLPLSANSDMIQPGGAVLGAVRFAFTPRPWGLTPGSSFLLVPALFHWIFAPVAVVGAVRLWRSSVLGRTLIFYFVIVVLFYAMIPRLQGPRHRLLCVFALTVFQFEGLYAWVTSALGRRLRPALVPGTTEGLT